jgi:hypothetical protein
MHSDWFNGLEILQGRWQHGEKVGYCYPSGLEKTLCKWDVYVLLVTKGLNRFYFKCFPVFKARWKFKKVIKSIYTPDGTGNLFLSHKYRGIQFKFL